MKRRVFIVTACAVFLCAIVVIAWPRGPKEPEYQGKKLSEWMALASGPDVRGRDASEKAIKEMGSNSLPFLFKWVSYQPATWQQILAYRPVRSSLVKTVTRPFYKGIARSIDAATCLEALGPGGNSVVGALGAELEAGLSPFTRNHVSSTLVYMYNRGADVRPAVPGLLAAAYGPRQEAADRMGCGSILTFLMTDTNYVQCAAQCLKHTNRVVRVEALYTLSDCGLLTAELVKPALGDGDVEVRTNAEAIMRAITAKPRAARD